MSAGMKSQGTAAPANKVNSVSDRSLKSSVSERQGASQTKTTVQKQSKSLQNNAEKKGTARIADPRIGSTSIDGSNKRCAPVHTMPTDEERRLELAWQAQQAARELEKQQTKDAEESRKAESDRKKREELRLAAADAIARLSEQIPDPTVANESSRESGDSVHNGGTYCGRIYVSRLMDFDDAEQAFCVPVPGENLQYSICWGNVPMPLRDILKEYCAVGGKITAKTEKSWINKAEYKLWVALYLE